MRRPAVNQAAIHVKANAGNFPDSAVPEKQLAEPEECCKLDFTHFKRHKRGNLQYDGTEWRGVSVHRSWRSIVKNPPTPTTSGYALRRCHPLLFLDFA